MTAADRQAWTEFLASKQGGLPGFETSDDLERAESEVQREVMAFLRRHPEVAWVDRFNSGRVQGVQLHGKDTPDVGGYLRARGNGYPRPFWIECKAAVGRLTGGQVKFLHQARVDGCLAGVARSAEDARKILAGIEGELR